MTTVKLFKHHLRVPFLVLLVVECGILYASNFIALVLRFGTVSWESFDNLAGKAAVVAIMLLLGLTAMGLYQAQRPAGRLVLPGIAFRVALGLLIGTLGLMVLYYVFPSLLIGRGVLALSLLCSLVLITLVRWLFYATVDSTVLRRRILVYGAGEPAAGLLSPDPVGNPLMPPSGSYLIDAFVPVEGEQVAVPDEYCVDLQESLLAYCQRRDVDEIVVAVRDRRNHLPIDALLDCKLSGVDVIDFISFHEREQGMLHLDILQPSWMIFSDGYERGSLRHVVGRGFDIAASLSILTLTAPILLLTALAIYLDSGCRGPVLYRQKRVGLNNTVFELIKFRSMRVDAEGDGRPVWARKNDDRITRVGHFIRKTRIDELPQLFNVLRGDMAVVGPRPERPEFVEQLEKSIPYYRLRHRVKPGLAGWAQLKYPYGANEKDAYNKLQFDLFYIKNRTILMDLLVLLQTIEVVVLGKGAR